MAGEERVSRKGIRLFGRQERLVARVANLSRDSTEEPDDHEIIWDDELDPKDANVITSIDSISARFSPSQMTKDLYAHYPVLDLDFHATLVPSSTFGHYHLLLDKQLSWEQMVDLLKSLARVGIIEEGYANASIERGYSALRLPHIAKETMNE